MSTTRTVFMGVLITATLAPPPPAAAAPSVTIGKGRDNRQRHRYVHQHRYRNPMNNVYWRTGRTPWIPSYEEGSDNEGFRRKANHRHAYWRVSMDRVRAELDQNTCLIPVPEHHPEPEALKRRDPASRACWQQAGTRSWAAELRPGTSDAVCDARLSLSAWSIAERSVEVRGRKSTDDGAVEPFSKRLDDARAFSNGSDIVLLGRPSDSGAPPAQGSNPTLWFCPADPNEWRSMDVGDQWITVYAAGAKRERIETIAKEIAESLETRFGRPSHEIFVLARPARDRIGGVRIAYSDMSLEPFLAQIAGGLFEAGENARVTYTRELPAPFAILVGRGPEEAETEHPLTH